MLLRESYFRSLLVICILLLLLSAPVFPQSVEATLSGVIIDEQGAVVSGVSVTVLNSATRLERSRARSYRVSA